MAPVPSEGFGSAGASLQYCWPWPFASPAGTGTVLVFQIGGGGADLQSEESDSMTAGITFNAEIVDQGDCALAQNYYDIDYENRIHDADRADERSPAAGSVWTRCDPCLWQTMRLRQRTWAS